MQEFLQAIWFSIAGQTFTYGQVLGALALVLIAILAYWLLAVRALNVYAERVPESALQTDRIRKLLLTLMGLGLLVLLLIALRLDPALFSNENLTIRISTLLQAVMILFLARLLDWVISNVLIDRYYRQRDKPRGTHTRKYNEKSASRTVQFAVYIIAIILILRSFQIDYTLHDIPLGKEEVFSLKISNIFIAILIILIARLIVWAMTQIFLYTLYRNREIDEGAQYAINQILKYVIYTLAVIYAIQTIGVQSTLILGGLAALLVGIGLGLQQTFNDFFSGLILLLERSVKIGDVLEVDGMVGTVQSIGIRASIVETRDNLSVVVPNSKLVTQNVTNWSHNDDKVRFWITLGVAYGSETEMVKKLLIQVANENPYVIDYPAPFVRFIDFADSSLNFELHFYSRNYIVIEDVKSDLRFEIDRQFRKHGVHIPFPQRDVWMKTD